MNQSALQTWIERLDYLERQEAICSDPAQKFNLQKEIEVCRQKINELRSETKGIPLEGLEESIVLLESREPQNSKVGVGFVIRSSYSGVYLLTCAHLVTELGGPDNLKVEGKRATVIALGAEQSLDIAVLKVEGIGRKKELLLGTGKQDGREFLAAGWQPLDRLQMLKGVEGRVINAVELRDPIKRERIKAWELQLDGNPYLNLGGSPMLDKNTKRVMGIIKDSQSKIGINIQELEKIWKYVDRQELYKKLCKLGYTKQVRLFQRLVRQQDIAGLLIYGPPDYGQQWLLNMLLSQHLPEGENSKPFIVGLNRRAKPVNPTVLLEEFCRKFGLSKAASLSEAVEAAYQAWQTQNIILIFHYVNWLGEENLKKLIEQFWYPLAAKIQEKCNEQQNEINSKLFMFLIDYEGNIGNSKSMLAQKDPSKAPKLQAFTEEELFSWLEQEKEEMLSKLAQDIDEQVEQIFENTEGIPEMTLPEVCALYDYDWIEESRQWLIF